MKTIELYVHMTEEEHEAFMAKYKDRQAMKFALSRLIDKAIKTETEEIQNHIEMGIIKTEEIA